MTSATATTVETGVLFPLVDGRRSTQTTARAVFAEATRSCAPDVADAIDSSEKWRRDYVARLIDIEAASASAPKNALLIAADGLAAVHERVGFARGGGGMPRAQGVAELWQGGVGTGANVGSGPPPGGVGEPE